MERETLDLKETANFLGFKSTSRLADKLKKGEIPGFKAGNRWMTYKPDLVEWTRAQYASRREAAQVGIGGMKWQSARKKVGVSYTQSSRSLESELMNRRKQIRDERLKSTRTSVGMK